MTKGSGNSENKQSIKRSKNNRLTLIVLIIMLTITVSYYLFDNYNGIFHKPIIYHAKIEDIGLPRIADSTYYIKNSVGRFSFYYSPEDKQAQWVAHTLTREDLKGISLPRSDNFLSDERIIKNSWDNASKPDYYKTSFDRGHLLPSADRNKSKVENIETFLFSNIAPQKANLNRNVWRIIEQQIRDWAEIYDTLYVVTGGVLNNNSLGYIGKSRITIPHSLYKVVLSVNNNQYNSIGFLVPNSSKVRSDYMQYSMSVDKIEEITGLDFYNNLPQHIQHEIERRYNKIFWQETQKKYIIYE